MIEFDGSDCKITIGGVEVPVRSVSYSDVFDAAKGHRRAIDRTPGTYTTDTITVPFKWTPQFRAIVDAFRARTKRRVERMRKRASIAARKDERRRAKAARRNGR